jgi:hypothetical protein
MQRLPRPLDCERIENKVRPFVSPDNISRRRKFGYASLRRYARAASTHRPRVPELLFLNRSASRA